MNNRIWSDPTIIAALISAGFALVSGFITLCVYNRKKKIEKKLETELESYKGWIQMNNMLVQGQIDTKLELLRVEYGALYSKRLKVIEEIYPKLLLLKLYFNIFTRALSKVELSNEEKKLLLNFNDSYEDFNSYFERNKLYLSKDIAQAIQGFVYILLSDTALKMPKEFIHLATEKSSIKEADFRKFVADFESLNLQPINPAEMLEAIENEFRSLIGADIKRQ